MKAFRVWFGRGAAALIGIASLSACGAGQGTLDSMGADAAADRHGCAMGDVYCTGCGGGGFCSQGCPTIVCPTGDGGMADGAAGGDAGADTRDAADARDADAIGCPSAAPTSCLDCSGGGFCVSGACPAKTCPVRDAGMGGFQAVCPGANPPPTGYPLCRSAADCTGGAFCAQQPFAGCGACISPQHACTLDTDCLPAGAAVCEPYVETSACLCTNSANGTRCMAKCPGRTCQTDTQCAATGHCQPTPCGQGYSCPSDRACKPSDTAADAHGCVPKLCTEGFTCAAGLVCNQTATQADPAHGCTPAPCSSGYACPTGWQCVAGPGGDVHGCTPISCSSGPPCGTNESCDPTQPGRGCVVRKCARDTDCDCGGCVQGNCQPSLWVCTSAPP